MNIGDMEKFTEEIISFLEANGFKCSHQMRNGLDVICTSTIDGRHAKVILPLQITAVSLEEADIANKIADDCISMIRIHDKCYPMIVTQDRWITQRSMTEDRILAHLELFEQIYARNCEVKRIEKKEAEEFLKANHSYGYAACRHKYGIFLKRHTGHNAEESNDSHIGKMIAVATFSNARKWMKDGKEIRSYEWTRYASLPQMRISGGMGKILKKFIKEVEPDDIMSYADLEWSEGDVYMTLGFRREGWKEPVMFQIDEQWKRFPIKQGMTTYKVMTGSTGYRLFRNFGSNKYRLKLTEYE